MAANFKGEWATVGVLTEKGQPKLSAAGKNFAIWKLASLDGAVISVFVFGDPYSRNWKESAGAVFAVFSAKVRLDEKVSPTLHESQYLIVRQIFIVATIIFFFDWMIGFEYLN
jgi:hypothetical protein